MRERPEGWTGGTLTIPGNLRDGFGMSVTLERLARLEGVMLDEISELKKLLK